MALQVRLLAFSCLFSLSPDRQYAAPKPVTVIKLKSYAAPLVRCRDRIRQLRLVMPGSIEGMRFHWRNPQRGYGEAEY